jgi:hypothetical protein
MRHSSARSTLLNAGFAGLLLLLPVAVSAATPPTPAPLTKSLIGEAKAAYDSGRLLFEDGDSPGALAKFSHAYDVSHDARLLWNMASCEKELRHYARAAALIGRYLQEGGDRIPAAQRKSALETQTALTAFYVSVKLSGAPDGASVFVDGTQVGQTPLTEPLLLDLGTRALRLEQTGFVPFQKNVEIAGGGELEVQVTLTPVPEVTVAPPVLSITTSGARDIIAIDGKVVGSQRWQGAVAVGEHSVRVTAAGKKPYESHIQLLAGSSRSLQIALDDENKGSTVWIWVAGGAAVAAGAVVGGFFLFKPQDTPGTHPEGKLTTVYLPLGGAR